MRLGDGRLVVNPGSVGSPGFAYHVPFPHVIEAGTPDARYAILELITASWSVTFRHVPYDHDAMAALARRNGDPEFGSRAGDGVGTVGMNKNGRLSPAVCTKSCAKRITPQR